MANVKKLYIIFNENEPIQVMFSALLARSLIRNKKNVEVLRVYPFLNVDFSTISMEFEGEGFILEDGSIASFSEGIFERILCRKFRSSDFITYGKIIGNVMEKEKKGYYLGRVVEYAWAISEEIRLTIHNRKPNILLLDIPLNKYSITELRILIETLRTLGRKYYKLYFLTVLVSDYSEIDYIFDYFRNFAENYLIPDYYIIFSRDKLSDKLKEKIKDFFDEKYRKVNVVIFDNIKNHLDLYRDMSEINKIVIKEEKTSWEFSSEILNKIIKDDFSKSIHLAIVSKYTNEKSAISLIDSLRICGSHLNVKVNIDFKPVYYLKDLSKDLAKYDGIVIPTGYGIRGVSNLLEVIKYARVHKIPFLGIGFGFELAVIEFARNFIGILDADSEELNEESKNKLFIKMFSFGGDVRAETASGLRKIELVEDTHVYNAYKLKEVSERVRHRYIFNLKYKDIIEEAGGVFSGFYNKEVVCFFELKKNIHPLFICSLPQVECNSNLEKVNPLIKYFVKNIINRKFEN